MGAGERLRAGRITRNVTRYRYKGRPAFRYGEPPCLSARANGRAGWTGWWLGKNLLAITSRSTDITQRLTAVDRALDLVRPLPSSEGRPALLGDLIAILLAPYDDMGAISGRIRVSVPRMGVGEAAATSLALVVHQFVTNSLKYGALSVPLGTLDVSRSSQEGVVVVSWTERGGPPVVKPPGPGCYESKLRDRAMPRQSDGSINHQWNEAGAIVTLTMNKAYLVTWRLKAVRSDGD